MSLSPGKESVVGCYPTKFSRSSYGSQSDTSQRSHDEKRDKKGAFKQKKDQGYAQLEGASSEEELVDESKCKGKKSAKVFGKLKVKQQKGVSVDEKISDVQNRKRLYDGHRKKYRNVKEKESVDLSLSENIQLKIAKRPIFCQPLNVVIKNQPSHDGIPIPAVVRLCIDCINERGIQMQGIYRLSPSKTKMNELKEILDDGYLHHDTVASMLDPICASSLLKYFLANLPDDLLTEEFHSKFEDGLEAKDAESSLEHVKNLATHLPEQNRTLLAYVFGHLKSIIDQADVNKMQLSNVGLIFQPVLKFSQPLLNVFLSNPSHLFPDIKIKKYVPPIRANSAKLAMEFPNSVKDIETELAKQESLLNCIHEEIKSGCANPKKEEHLWDTQRLITQLKRELKKLKKHYQNSPLPLSDSTGQETLPALTLEMFEEKQLLAVQTELIDSIQIEERDIQELCQQLVRLRSEYALIDPVAVHLDSVEDHSLTDEEWQRRLTIEKERQTNLLAEVIKQNFLCARLRAQLEMLEIEHHDVSSPTTRL